MKKATSHAWIWLIVAVIARLAVMGFYFTHHGLTDFYGNGFEMAMTASSIVAGHGLSSPFGGATGPTAFLAPGYPMLVAGVFAIAGVGSRASAILIVSIQCLFSCLTVALVIQIARKIANTQTANLSGMLCALAPPLLFEITIFWDTSLTVFLLVGFIALALKDGPTWHRGLYSGIAGLCNPALLPAIFAIEAWGAIKRRRFPTGAILAFVLTFSVWPIRNMMVMHAPVLLRSDLGLELWIGNHPGADGYFTPAMHPAFSEREREQFASLGELPYMREKQNLALTYIRQHPGTFLALTAKRFFRFWLGLSPRGGDGTAMFTLLAVVGLFLLRPTAPLILPLLLYPLPYCLTHADARYSYPMVPLLVIFAAGAMSRLLDLLTTPPRSSSKTTA